MVEILGLYQTVMLLLDVLKSRQFISVFHTSSLHAILSSAMHSSGQGRVNKTMLLPLEI